MRWIEWTSTRSNYKRGEKPNPRSPGRCVYSFRKGGGRYTYVCKRRLMTLQVYERWIKAGSKGKFYNRNIKGVY